MHRSLCMLVACLSLAGAGQTLRIYETPKGIDWSGTTSVVGAWRAELLFWPERIGIADGEAIEFGVRVSGPDGSTGQVQSFWRLTSGQRELPLGEPASIALEAGAAIDARTALVMGWGAGDYWLVCGVTLPDGKTLALRRPLTILRLEPRSAFPIYANAAFPKGEHPWRHGADAAAAAGVTHVLNNAIDDWNGGQGRLGAERVDQFALHGIRWVDFPSTLDWTLTHAPIATGLWDAYHDPDIRAFCRQLSQCVAQWGRQSPSFDGIALMDEPSSRSFWGNNPQIFRQHYLTYDAAKEPLRFLGDWQHFACWSMGELFRDCRDAVRRVDSRQLVCVEAHNNLGAGSGIYAALNTGHMDINTTHHYYGDYHWGPYATSFGCETAQMGLRDKPLWMMGGFHLRSEAKYRAQVGQALARGAKAWGYFEHASPKRGEDVWPLVTPINRFLEKYGAIFRHARRVRSEFGVLFSVRNNAFFAAHPPTRFDATSDAKATVAAAQAALDALPGEPKLTVEQSTVLPKGDYSGACMNAFMALVLSNYEVEFLGEEDLTPEGLEGKEVIVAPQILYLPDAAWAALNAFRKKGGVVITDDGTRAKTPGWQRLPVRFEGCVPAKPYEQRTDADEAAFEKARQTLVAAAAEHCQPRVQGLASGMVTGWFDGGEARYLVISNCSHRRNKDGVRELAPFTGTVAVKNVSAGVRVRLGEDKPIEGGAEQSWRLDLPPGHFAVFAFAPTAEAATIGRPPATKPKTQPRVPLRPLLSVVLSCPEAIAGFPEAFPKVCLVAPAELHKAAARLAERLKPLFEELTVATPEAVRQVEKMPPVMDPEVYRKRYGKHFAIHPHFNPTQLAVGRAAILLGTERNNALFRDLLQANLLPRRLDHPLYADRAVVQYAWAPFDPDLDVVVVRAESTLLLEQAVERLRSLWSEKK